VNVAELLKQALAVPGGALGALQTLQTIADNTDAMEAHTAVLRDMTAVLERVARDTDALPALRKDMARVAKATAVLDPMDGRMANIEGAMPALAEVQQQLSALPQTMASLDARIAKLSTTLERMLTAMEGLAGSVEDLRGAVGPMSRLASRLPGQSRPERDRAGG